MMVPQAKQLISINGLYNIPELCISTKEYLSGSTLKLFLCKKGMMFAGTISKSTIQPLNVEHNKKIKLRT
jgi:hypothetical protein